MGSVARSVVSPDERVTFCLSKAKEAQMAAAVAQCNHARRSLLAASNSWLAAAAELQNDFHMDWRRGEA